MPVVSYYKNLSLSKKIYISTAIGFLVGMFFGDRCEVLNPVNTLFIKIFQITIIPYMVFSIVHSIGSLTTERAKIVGKKGGKVLLSLWAVSMIFAFGLQFSFPQLERSKFFRPENSLKGTGINFFDMFIPSNPFYSLANGYIPAIVIFCILIGMALIHQEHKSGIVKSAKIWASLMNSANKYIMSLLPLGVLVMSTYTFGTLSLMKFKGVLLFILASIFYLVFISMVIYPAILTSVSKINYGKFLYYAMPAALIGFTTGSVFLALPVIYNQMYKFNEEEKGFLAMGDVTNERGLNAISILVPLAWVVPASYKFLVIFFVVFAHWYYDRAFHIGEQLLFYIGGIPCLFGSNSVIVPFLLEMSGDLPNKAYDIFLLTSNFMVYFNNANGAIFIIVCTMLCYLSLSHNLRIRWVKLLSILAVSVLFFSVTVVGISVAMTKLLAGDDEVKQELTHMNLQLFNTYAYEKINITYPTLEQYHYIEPLFPDEPLLDKIVRTKTLQVGYDSEAVPFSFFNGQGKLVGYDIDFVLDVAKNLKINNIEFYPVHNFMEYHNCLDKGIYLNMCVGGFVYMGMVEGNVITSDPYMKLTPAIVIPMKDKAKFPDFGSVYTADNVTLGVRLSEDIGGEYHSKNRPVVTLNSFSEFYKEHKTEALLTSAEIASALGIIYHGYWVYYYLEPDIKLFYAYLLPYSKQTETFRDMINAWISVCRWNGTYEKRYKYWIMGESDVKLNKTWSILSWLQKNITF